MMFLCDRVKHQLLDRRSIFVFLFLAPLAVTSGCEESPRGSSERGVLHQGLRAGEPLSSLAGLLEEQAAAIGHIAEVTGERRCTALLISSRRVITAAHCFALGAGASPLEVALEVQRLTFEANGHRYPLVDVALHPQLDLAVPTLGVPVDGATPLELTAAEDNLDIESEIIVIGGGAFTDPAWGLAYAPFVVTGITEDKLELEAALGVGTCPGDSGGPYLVMDRGPTLVGIHSRGESDCSPPSRGVRLAAAVQWLEEKLNEIIPPQLEPCAPDESPSCNGTSLLTCVAGFRSPIDCLIGHYRCAPINGTNTCVPVPCGDVSPRGECEGAVAQRCEYGTLVEEICDSPGEGCGFIPETGRVGCAVCDVCDGACVDLKMDPLHCGDCFHRCLPEGRATCEDGACLRMSLSEDEADRPADAQSTSEQEPASSQSCATLSSPGLLPWLIIMSFGRCFRRRFRATSSPGRGETPGSVARKPSFRYDASSL